jgi:hypothetical protein
MRTEIVYGYLLRVVERKGRGGYVCWNSFQAKWTLGPRRLSEIFWNNTGAIIEDAFSAFPTAVIEYERSKVD